MLQAKAVQKASSALAVNHYRFSKKRERKALLTSGPLVDETIKTIFSPVGHFFRSRSRTLNKPSQSDSNVRLYQGYVSNEPDFTRIRVYNSVPLSASVLDELADLKTSSRNPRVNEIIDKGFKVLKRLGEKHLPSLLHSDRVTQTAIKMGAELLGDNFNERFILLFSSLEHDVGKSADSLTTVNPADGFCILDKPGRPTEDEFKLIKKHPEDGVRMLQAVGLTNDDLSFDVVGRHHKNVDLKGGYGVEVDRPLDFLTRIVEVADVYDALTDITRTYKVVCTPKDAIKAMSREIGTKFDEECIRALLKVEQKEIKELRGYTLKKLMEEDKAETLALKLIVAVSESAPDRYITKLIAEVKAADTENKVAESLVLKELREDTGEDIIQMLQRKGHYEGPFIRRVKEEFKPYLMVA